MERLECARSGATPRNTDDIQALNEKNFEARRNRAWDEIIADLDTAFEKLAEQTRALSEADLSEAGRFPWQRGERALVWAAFVFVGNLVGLMAYLLAREPAPGTRHL